VLPPAVVRLPPSPVLTTVHLAPHPAPALGLGYKHSPAAATAAAPPYMPMPLAVPAGAVGGRPSGMGPGAVVLQPLGPPGRPVHGVVAGPPIINLTLAPGNPYGTNRAYRGGQLTRGGPRMF